MARAPRNPRCAARPARRAVKSIGRPTSWTRRGRPADVTGHMGLRPESRRSARVQAARPPGPGNGRNYLLHLDVAIGPVDEAEIRHAVAGSRRDPGLNIADLVRRGRIALPVVLHLPDDVLPHQ